MGGERSQKLGPGEECESSPGHAIFGQRKINTLPQRAVYFSRRGGAVCGCVRADSLYNQLFLLQK